VKLARVLRDGPDGADPRIVAVHPEREAVVDLAAAERARLARAGATGEAARRIAGALFPASMAAAIAGGPAFLEAARRALEEADDEATLPMAEVRWTAPLDPPVVRDFSAFERHLRNAYARAKRPVPEEFYRSPVYYKLNPTTITGHDTEIPWPDGSRYLDYELEVGLVVGRAGRDLLPEEAAAHLFGVTVLNDFSARDLQARESSAGLGPAKGKDFATAVGPWITTADEVDVQNLDMVARVNGEEWSRGTTATMLWSAAELVAYASRSETIVPGELIGTGTVGFGSGLELYRRLQPGDLVELEVAGVGTLRNRVGEPVPARWAPSAKQPTEEE
jgi:2-keto-4-pentenoate hydratase/2-oxohepta-3-ene-1,7-dioic acid hydratase in catechol pathway